MYRGEYHKRDGKVRVVVRPDAGPRHVLLLYFCTAPTERHQPTHTPSASHRDMPLAAQWTSVAERQAEAECKDDGCWTQETSH